jgi:hypothetical protein
MSTKLNNLSEQSNDLVEYARMYYEHQYERLAKLEEQRLTITNIVITISIVAFTFGFSDIKNLTVLNGLGLPMVMIIANVFAIAYISRSADFIRVHKKRARRILELYANELFQLNQSIDWPKRGWFMSRMRIQVSIHILLMIAALLPAYTYLRNGF